LRDSSWLAAHYALVNVRYYVRLCCRIVALLRIATLFHDIIKLLWTMSMAIEQPSFAL